MSFRCAYSLDGQGFDFTSSYAKKYLKKSPVAPVPVLDSVAPKRPTFTRCAYSMDAQGHDLTYPKEYSVSTSTTPSTLSRNNSYAMLGDDGQWRALYDMGQRPNLPPRKSEADVAVGSKE